MDDVNSSTTRAPAPASTTAAAPAPGGHHGRVGLPTASALYIAAVLGTGILGSARTGGGGRGARVARRGAAVLLLSIPLAGTFAALAARYPDAGGVATFVRLALGNTAARMAGYWFLFGVQFGAPVVATLGGEYRRRRPRRDRGAVCDRRARVPATAARGQLLRPAGERQGAARTHGSARRARCGRDRDCGPAIEATNFDPVHAATAGRASALAISLFVWAFAGWEAVTHLAGEFRNPRRTIPLATGIAIVVVGVAYLALQFVTVGVLGVGRRESARCRSSTSSRSRSRDRSDRRRRDRGDRRGRGAQRLHPRVREPRGIPRSRRPPARVGSRKGAEGGAVPRRALVLVDRDRARYFGRVLPAGLELDAVHPHPHRVDGRGLRARHGRGGAICSSAGRVGWWMAVVVAS